MKTKYQTYHFMATMCGTKITGITLRQKMSKKTQTVRPVDINGARAELSAANQLKVTDWGTNAKQTEACTVPGLSE